MADNYPADWCINQKIYPARLYEFIYASIPYHYTGEFLSRILHYQTFVILSILSSLSSSANNAESCDFLNNLLSKSRSNQMLSLPELQDNATYRLNKSSPPVGGLAMSIMTYSNVRPCDR
jgi:hypothetical protein